MSGSARNETMMAVVNGALSPAQAARRLETTEEQVREWAERIARDSELRRRRQLLEERAAFRSSLAIALAIGSTLVLSVWGTSDVWSRGVCRSVDTVSAASPIRMLCER